PQISERIGDLDIKLSPDAFHQLNTDQMLILYQEIAKAAGLTGAETVIDCYSGVGIISLMLAKMAAQVVGVDYSEASIRDAKANAILNRIKNVTFIQDRVEKALPLILAKKGISDVIVFDPPRTGLEDSTIAEVIKSKAKRIVYVSCNPSTLAKNLNDFEAFYDIAFIQPIDMFPHTAGVESVTLLKRKAA
ncbi:MAG: 23S rRNA (uracil(1939)-C(5))-methyltransferase RlmD, partial [bacterium]